MGKIQHIFLAKEVHSFKYSASTIQAIYVQQAQ